MYLADEFGIYMYQICRHVLKIIAKSCTIGAYLVKLVFFNTALLFRLRTNLESTCMAFKTTCSIDLPLPKLLRRCYRFISQCTFRMLLLSIISLKFLQKTITNKISWRIEILPGRKPGRHWVLEACLIIAL